MVACEHCGVEVEDGAFCSACGAHLSHADQTSATTRRHAFAAHPHEAVHQPALLTTLLPHLSRLRLHKYRWALVGGAALVVAALLFANVGVAVVVAALVVPFIYVMYIYDADVHEGEPIAVIACTVIAGGVLGAALALVARAYVARTALTQLASPIDRGPSIGYILFIGVTLPIAGELAKLVGPLVLRRWAHFRNEVMDGVVFGVAAGVGFAAGSTIVNYWSFIRTGYSPLGGAGLSDWAGTLLGLAFLRPLIHGTTVGLIGSGVWAAFLRRGSVALPIAIGFAGAILYPLGEIFLRGRGTIIVIFFHAILLAALLTVLRRVIHDDLLEDARALGLDGGYVECNNCQRRTQARVFCTQCGTALRAQPKRVRAAVDGSRVRE
jgi:RsiW-degrading membrane proteinase PrsW (M82 family)